MRERTSRRLGLIAAMVLSVGALGARRSDLRGFTCARFVAFQVTQQPWIQVASFSADSTWTVGGEQIPIGIRAANPGRSFAFFSDTSARTYVFDHDLTDTSKRWGVGAPIHCGAYYAAQGDGAFGYEWHNDPYPGWQEFSTRCAPEGSDLRAVCEGRTCGECQLLAPPECFEWNGPGVVWHTGDVDPVQPLVSARVPWERDSNAEWQQVVVATDSGSAPWPHTLTSMRSYDTGACDLTISWPRLANDLNSALFPTLVDQIAHTSHINNVSFATLSGSVGPMLRGLGQDDIFLRTDLQGILNVGLATGAEDRSFFAHTFTRLSVSSQTILDGGMRVVIPYVTSWVDNQPAEFWDLSERFAPGLSSPTTGLKTRLAAALNQALLVPIPNGLQLVGCPEAWVPGSQASAPRTDCLNDIQGSETLFVGQEAGCFPFTEFSPSILGRPDVQALRAQSGMQGMCATRLQPHRVNILPEGLQIVLIEQGAADPTPDPQYALLQDPGFRALMGAAGIVAAPAGTSTTGLSLDCDSTRPNSSAPSGFLVESGAIDEAPAVAHICRTVAECQTCAMGGACLCAPGVPCS